MTPTAFSRLIDRFYNVATSALIETGAIIDKLAGDQVAGIFAPGLAGPQHAQQAISAAQIILRATGHGTAEGPWIPLGAGVHSGTAFVGAVGSPDGTIDITVLGDAANTAARLSSSARQGEIIISTAACEAVGPDFPALDRLQVRQLQLKGKSEPVSVKVLTMHEGVLDRSQTLTTR
jgi:adenylate cyclase